MQSDDPVMPRAASVSGAVSAGAEPQADEDVALTPEQAEELLAFLEQLKDGPFESRHWLATLVYDEFEWAVNLASESGSICEFGFEIVPPEKP